MIDGVHNTASARPSSSLSSAAAPATPPGLKNYFKTHEGRYEVPLSSPLVAHTVQAEPLSGLIFTQDAELTVCRKGHKKIWMRPGIAESQKVGFGDLLNLESEG